MTALGRVLQIIGWLWIAVGFFGPAVNLPDVSVFPGIIILFISRVLRRQSSQTSPEDEEVERAAREQEMPRMLNTDRPARPAPHPVAKPQPKAMPEPKTTSGTKGTYEPNVTFGPERKPKTELGPKPKPNPEPIADDKGDLLERVLLAGQEVAAKSHAPVYPKPASEKEDRPLTSAEMIARAHRRWGRKR